MSITQSQIFEMHEVLREKLGVNAADTLIEHLPPEGWSNVATKKDLSQVRTELQMEIALLRSELHQEIALLRSEMIQMEERLTMKFDLAIKEGFARQNKWMFGILITMNVTLAVAMMR
jgi:hypothetical protein